MFGRTGDGLLVSLFAVVDRFLLNPILPGAIRSRRGSGDWWDGKLAEWDGGGGGGGSGTVHDLVDIPHAACSPSIFVHPYTPTVRNQPLGENQSSGLSASPCGNLYISQRP